MIKSYMKLLKKSTDLGGQKWSKNGIQYFFTFNVNKYLLNRHRTNLGQNLFIIGPSISPLGGSKGPLGPMSIFFCPPLGASWARPGVVQDPPEASPEALGGFLYW